MTSVTTKDGVQIFYKDWGPKAAQPIVFHHGWPLSADDWDAQMLFFLAQGFRVVARPGVAGDHDEPRRERLVHSELCLDAELVRAAHRKLADET